MTYQLPFGLPAPVPNLLTRCTRSLLTLYSDSCCPVSKVYTPRWFGTKIAVNDTGHLRPNTNSFQIQKMRPNRHLEVSWRLLEPSQRWLGGALAVRCLKRFWRASGHLLLKYWISSFSIVFIDFFDACNGCLRSTELVPERFLEAILINLTLA